MKTKGLLTLWLGLAIAGLIWIPNGCRTSEQQGQMTERGRDPWVFRSVLDEQARMLTIALQEDFWIAYDAQDCHLYKVWRDGVELAGAVYTNAHGPQPTSQGPAWLQNNAKQAWSLLQDGKTIPLKARYHGHRYAGESILLSYSLETPSGQRIKIEERPEYVESEAGMPGLERRFKVSGQPEGTSLQLQTKVQSILADRFLETDGDFTFGERQSRTVNWVYQLDADGQLRLNANGSTYLRLYFAREPGLGIGGGDETAAVREHPGLTLINEGDCRSCHNEQVYTVGPAYQAIAEKYPNRPSTIKNLSRKIRLGGSGVWGAAAMTAHPDLTQENAELMVDYILSLDTEEEEGPEDPLFSEIPRKIDYTAEGQARTEGLAVSVYAFGEGEPTRIPEIAADRKPDYAGTSEEIFLWDDSFAPLSHNFVMHLKGIITVDKTTKYDFRLRSDDGSRLTIDGKVVIDHDGLHGASPVDGEIELKKGPHEVLIEYFENSGGRALVWQWLPHGADFFELVPAEILSHEESMKGDAEPYTEEQAESLIVYGDSSSLNGVHPSFDLAQARPADFQKRIGGMDFRGDDLIVSTWDEAGDVYLLEGVSGDDPEAIEVTRIATGLAEPLGVKVVDGRLYVLQKQELTELIDHDGDKVADEYRTVCNGWKVSANFHEFAFGLVEKDGYLYATLATAIMPGGASADPQIPDRGKVVKIDPRSGTFEFIASGLRTPNGIGLGFNDEIYVADNQGDWLPSSKIVHITEGSWYGSRSVDFDGTATLSEKKPVVWLPQDEIGNSPSQPGQIMVGPYKGQMIHGEVTHGGVKRVFVDEVNGQYQGALFRFTQGIEAGVNRLVWGPDGALYLGGVGSTGNWRHMTDAMNNWFGLQKLTYNQKSTFEMLAIRAQRNGFEIEFTEPLANDMPAESLDSYMIKSWYYLP
ncbi:MAG: PA14 domain-containing protein, partial [Bacteroidota bacterium]